MVRSFARAAAFMIFLASASVPALATDRSHVSCADGKSFELDRKEGLAVVILGDRTINMQRKPSSLGPSYGSADGSLIIDRDYVAFVLSDDLGFRNCRLIDSHEK